MSQPVLRSWSTQQCLQSCNTQRNTCTAMNISNPSPVNAFKIQQCHTNYNTCVNACNTNNIRPGKN